MRRRVRLGMIGGGQGAFIGAVHRIAARLDDQFALVAGALSADPARARASADELGLDPSRAYDDYASLIRGEAARADGIEAVAIVTPNHMHVPPAIMALEAGIDVICDKPLAVSLDDARTLQEAVHRTGLVFVLTHNYTGAPMVRQARAMVAAGELGPIRLVQVEYLQDWLTTRLEETGHKQAAWRSDPARSGPAGCTGDIGTHAYNLARFITGLPLAALSAELTTFVPGRVLDDDARMLLRFEGGARGTLWASQVAPGCENGLRIRIYGEKAGLAWEQENPNHLVFTPHGEPPRLLRRAGAGANPAAAAVSRIPAGHPEGYLEAFATIYGDAAEQIRARREGRPPAEGALLAPGIEEGVEGVAFIEAAIASSRGNAKWVGLSK